MEPQNHKQQTQRELPFDAPMRQKETSSEEPPPGPSDSASGSELTGEANAYEEKLERRRERLEAAAEKARASSDAHFQRSRAAVEHIPFGQPILTGHHSERRHRRDIERSHGAMDRAVSEANRASHLEQRASRVGTGGISADDPAATRKLTHQLHDMEERREMMKRVNREYSRGGWDEVSDISDAARERLRAAMAHLPLHDARPFPPYALKNLGANIRRVKCRIEELSKASEQEERAVVEGAGYSLEESKADNRIRFVFDDKPEASIRSLLKREGFRWARSVGAWQRQTTAAGWGAAERVRDALDGTTDSASRSAATPPDKVDATISWVRAHDRNEVIARIRAGLNKRSDRAWSVTGGRGTSHGWLQIDAPPKRRTFDNRQTGEVGGDGLPLYALVDVGPSGYLMGPDDRAELARLLGYESQDSVPHQGVKVAGAHDYYAEFIDRSEGRHPSVTGKPYWD